EMLEAPEVLGGAEPLPHHRVDAIPAAAGAAEEAQLAESVDGGDAGEPVQPGVRVDPAAEHGLGLLARPAPRRVDRPQPPRLRAGEDILDGGRSDRLALVIHERDPPDRVLPEQRRAILAVRLRTDRHVFEHAPPERPANEAVGPIAQPVLLEL